MTGWAVVAGSDPACTFKPSHSSTCSDDDVCILMVAAIKRHYNKSFEF